jgi:hypothetical protein
MAERPGAVPMVRLCSEAPGLSQPLVNGWHARTPGLTVLRIRA